MELQKGRPKYTAGRLEKEIRTYDLLDKLGVAYERVDHEQQSAKIFFCAIVRKASFIY